MVSAIVLVDCPGWWNQWHPCFLELLLELVFRMLFIQSVQMPCSKTSNVECGIRRVHAPNVINIYFFLSEFPSRKIYFITAQHFFYSEISIFITNLQQTQNDQATVMKFRSDLYKPVNINVIEVSEVGKAKDLSVAPLETCSILSWFHLDTIYFPSWHQVETKCDKVSRLHLSHMHLFSLNMSLHV